MGTSAARKDREITRDLSSQVKDRLIRKWPEAIRCLTRRSELCFPTGLAALDRLFPSGRGFPYGQLVEITGGPSSGKTSLLLSILAAGSRNRRRIAYVDFGGAFCPDAALAAGLDIKRLLIIRPEVDRQVTPPRQMWTRLGGPGTVKGGSQDLTKQGNGQTAQPGRFGRPPGRHEPGMLLHVPEGPAPFQADPGEGEVGDPGVRECGLPHVQAVE